MRVNEKFYVLLIKKLKIIKRSISAEIQTYNLSDLSA